MTGRHWLWTGALLPRGYGQFNTTGNAHWLAHRLVWYLLGGELPEDLHHDGCPHKNCVRPGCLTPFTKAEHTKEHHPPPTHCSSGHEYTAQNTYVRRDGAGRQCRRCKADRERARKAAMTYEQRHAVHLQTSEARRRRKANSG